MEKLLITLSHSDGYTYSSEETKPAIYSSKEEFIIQLEDLTQDYLNSVKKYNKNQEKYDKEYNSTREIYSATLEREKRSKKNPALTEKVEEVSKKMMEVINNRDNFILKNKPTSTFSLGGQEFEFENFFYNDESNKESIVSIPQVQTIAEYFEEVEIGLNINKKHKPQ